MVDLVTGVFDPRDSRRLSRDLLLLSQSLLPVVFSIAAGSPYATPPSATAAKRDSLFSCKTPIVIFSISRSSFSLFSGGMPSSPSDFRTVSVWAWARSCLINAALFSLFSFSCNSCRHLCGGYLNSFHDAPGKYKTWTLIGKLNEKHMEYAWVSLIWVGLTDAYVRLLAMGMITDLRFF